MSNNTDQTAPVQLRISEKVGMATAIVDGPAGPIVSDVPTASVAEGSSNPDVDEKAKMLKATRQSASLRFTIQIELHTQRWYPIAEFYFADSNLPFDRYMIMISYPVSLSKALLLTNSSCILQIHVDIAYC